MESRHSALDYRLLFASRGAALLLFAEAACAWLPGADATGSEQMLVRAVLTLALATVLLPQPDPAEPRAGRLLLGWALLSGASIVAGLLWSGWDSRQTGRIMQLAGGTALLVLTFGCLRQSLALCLKDRRIASQTSLAALLISLTLPLWAAPVALVHGAGKWVVDTIVALCPASYLAALARIDYLRGDWMYQHAPYGSLRFDYPDPVHATALLLVLCAFFITAARLRLPAKRPGQLPAIAPQLLEIKP